MKKYLLYTVILFSLPAYSQQSVVGDTIEISEVIISRRKLDLQQAGFKKASLDSVILRQNNLQSVGEMLSENSTIYIKSYGSGGTATPSIRGTGASHTRVAWNGININNPMLGQSDFSLIPAGMTDNVEILYGSTSSDAGNGAIGGTINLENKPVWDKKTIIDFYPGAGSFGSYSGLIKLRSGNEQFQFVSRAYIRYSRNDFPYLNTEMGPEPVPEIRENSQFSGKGIMQEFYFRKKSDILSARVWYQSTDRNLPGSMLTGKINSGEKQYDESLRSLITYDFDKSNNNFFITGAFQISRLNYSNRLASVFSKNLSRSLLLKGGVTAPIGENTKLKLIVNDEINSIESNNYVSVALKNTASVTLVAESGYNDRIETSILIREIIDDKTLLIPDFSAGIEYRIIAGENYFLKSNLSRTSGIPSMNDLYWNPGGNPDLKNEYSYSFEIGYSMDQKISSTALLKSEINVFTNLIKDMIQWHPGEFSYWIADNMKNVSSSGLELLLSFRYSQHKFKMHLNAGYSYTRAITLAGKSSDKTGKQIMYIPENKANSSIFLGFGDLYTIFSSGFTGRTFITADNSDFLHGYTISDLITGFKISIRKSLFDLNFKIENLFDITYQTMAHFPQPGRTLCLNLMIRFSK